LRRMGEPHRRRQAPVQPFLPGETRPWREPRSPASAGAPSPSPASRSRAPGPDRASPHAPRPAARPPSIPPPDAASPAPPHHDGRSSPGRPPSPGSRTVPPRCNPAPSRQAGDAARHRRDLLHGRTADALRQPTAFEPAYGQGRAGAAPLQSGAAHRRARPALLRPRSPPCGHPAR
jgi:hypothetical protein